MIRPTLHMPGHVMLMALATSGLIIAGAIAAPPKTSNQTGAPSLFAPAKKAPAQQQDVAKTVPTATANTADARAAAADQRPYVMRLDVDVKPGQDMEAAYFEYFSKNRVHPKVIRGKVRRVANNESNKQRFAEIVAILRASLRAGQVQPWMYEALGLAMRMNKMPADEIERTLLSAADFAKEPAQLIYLADYLDRLGFRDRALRLLRDVSEQNPYDSDPYVRGLRLAKTLKDDEAIIWAAEGILRQAWPQNQRSVRNDARLAALATIKRLRKENKKELADRYATKIKSVLVRDVVVRVSWAGEADVDIMVEEPSGSVCSYRNPRTSSGGVLVGDTNTKVDRSAGKGYSETYVCPEGFSGTYRVLLRQVWGHIPAGKVNIEVWTHGGTKQQVTKTKVVPLDEKDSAMIVFDLENGRRVESLKDHQIANDVKTQLAVNRAVLAQQINALASTQQINGQQISDQAQTPFVTGTTPILDNDGRLVGFRPDISIIPTGATMSVNAVISADRRYVRITALPFFSGVTAVTQYNLGVGVTGIDTDLGTIDLDVGLDRDQDTDLDVGLDAA